MKQRMQYYRVYSLFMVSNNVVQLLEAVCIISWSNAGFDIIHRRISQHVLSNAEIYPFAVEVTRNRVPVMHLLTRIMATVGGVFTIMSLIDGALYSREKKKVGGGSRRWMNYVMILHPPHYLQKIDISDQINSIGIRI